MVVIQDSIQIKTREMSITDITSQVQKVISTSNINTGTVNVFNVGSTATISTIEHESGLLADLPELLQKLIPAGIGYKHDITWNDDNGHSHLRATIMGPSTTIPFNEGMLMCGTWQQICHIEFDHKPRNRKIIITVIGE